MKIEKRNITGTEVAYYHLCHRKLWLFSNGIQMEHESDLVAEGNLIHETSYPQRAARWQEVEIEGIKVDFYDPNRGIIHEIKKSPKKEDAHEAQLKYYLFVLEKNGFLIRHGVLEYPKIRLTEKIFLTDIDREVIPEWKRKIEAISENKVCPPTIESRICKKCAYYDFCYSQ